MKIVYHPEGRWHNADGYFDFVFPAVRECTEPILPLVIFQLKHRGKQFVGESTLTAGDKIGQNARFNRTSVPWREVPGVLTNVELTRFHAAMCEAVWTAPFNMGAIRGVPDNSQRRTRYNLLLQTLPRPAFTTPRPEHPRPRHHRDRTWRNRILSG